MAAPGIRDVPSLDDLHADVDGIRAEIEAKDALVREHLAAGDSDGAATLILEIRALVEERYYPALARCYRAELVRGALPPECWGLADDYDGRLAPLPFVGAEG